MNDDNDEEDVIDSDVEPWLSSQTAEQTEKRGKKDLSSETSWSQWIF